MPVKEYTNRLINEKSPYLLQHAHNPVEWYPWGDEAFAKAKAEDKPVFLSIGYSTCHWCHVMERESFEDEDVAKLLNENYVSIKVDREELPDVDHLYMTACTALSGSGGWPLSCFLTPDKKPFYTGTYFPKVDRYGIPGFQSVLRQIAGLWKSSRKDLTEASVAVLNHMGKAERSGAGKEPSLSAEDEAFRQLRDSFDPKYGGFGGAPKFPTVVTLLFLMRYGYARKNETALEMVRKTLSAMRRGGIYDQVGGGFCRYSTDEKWLVPHFEKMLYDNALHILAYAEAGAFLDSSWFGTVRETARFCMREMRDASGGFYTALDADSEGQEGKFYLFSPENVRKALGGADAARWCGVYGVTEKGNYEGKSIPNLLSNDLMSGDREFTAEANQKMYEYRDRRVHPFRDEKLLVSDNGMMIAALSAAARMSGDQSLLEAAKGCARPLIKNLSQSGGLKSRLAGGEGPSASGDDYACLIWGLIELYEAALEPDWLEYALRLQENFDREYWDDVDGGYFMGGTQSGLPIRQKQFYDSAVPSSNSVAALNLIRLSRLTGETRYEDRADGIFRAAGESLNSHPASHCGLLCALLYAREGGTEILLANGGGFEELKSGIPAFLPFAVTAACGKGYEKMDSLAPYSMEYKPVGGRAAAYVCRGGSCERPVTEPSGLTALLSAGRTGAR